MKKNLIALLALGTACVPLSHGEIVLSEDLSVYGYLDMYASGIDMPGDNSTTSVAEFELAFNYTTEPYFSVVELSYDGQSDVGFETAVIGWNVSDELSLSAGNILSYLGWETYDATGLYQFSYAYRDFSPLYPAYAVGGALDYVTDNYSFGIWIGDSDSHDVSLEYAFKYTGIEGLTLFAGYADDPYYDTLNFWASYEAGSFTFAAEYVDVDNKGGAEHEGYLAMINYAWENAGLTFRYSVEDTEFIADDWKLFTISPSYTFSDNLLGLVELSLIDDGGAADYQWAAELIYVF
jgi:hypothetical protein